MRKVGQATSVQISNVKSVIGREAAFNFTLWEVGKEDVVTFAVRKAGGLRYGAVFPDGEPLVSGVRTYDTPKEAIKALNIKDSVIKDSGMKDVVYICEKCHSQVSDSQQFCDHCGSQFDADGFFRISQIKVGRTYLAVDSETGGDEEEVVVTNVKQDPTSGRKLSDKEKYYTVGIKYKESGEKENWYLEENDKVFKK